MYSKLRKKIICSIIVTSCLMMAIGVVSITSVMIKNTEQYMLAKMKEMSAKNNEYNENYNSIKFEYDNFFSEVEKTANKNEELKRNNVILQNNVKSVFSKGPTPGSYKFAEKKTKPFIPQLNGRLIGEAQCSYYSPNSKECSNKLGITASGEPIVPGVSIAIDSKYHKFRTLYWLSGIGFVESHDTGSAIKGETRIDIATLNTTIAKTLGRDKRKFYIIQI